MRLLFVCDPLAGLKTYKDTSFAMMQAAQERGHTIWACQPAHLSAGFSESRGCQPTAMADRIEIQGADANEWWTVVESRALSPTDLDAVLMRKDPPFDQDYLVATQMLELFERSGVPVVNRPAALRDHGEKLSVLEFPAYAPAGFVSSCISDLASFAAQHPKVVFKPLDAMGGSGIFVSHAQDPNLPVILEVLTKNGQQAIMGQEWLPEIVDGDKRILIINGEPFSHCLARIPQAGASRGNLAAGGRGEARPLTPRDREIAEGLGPHLKRRGIFLAGIDVIGERLTEINITSPTGFREIHDQTGLNVAVHFIEQLESMVKSSQRH